MGVCSDFDVIIVGGGPSGMAAALWCDELGLSSCLFEVSGTLGGQLSWIHNPIRNYLGLEFRDGTDCLDKFQASLADRQFQLFSDITVFSISAETCEVITSAGKFAGKAIIIATGVRRRKLDVPGEVEYRGRGILESGSRDRKQVAGARVAVIGGGDAALENALILADFADKVYLIHRRNRFSAREEFRNAVAANSKIDTLFQYEVERFGGGSELSYMDLRSVDGTSRRLGASKAVVRIGVEPNSELLVDHNDLDSNGYVKVNHLGQTAVKNLYAIGDVSNPVAPTIASAVGSAACAVKAIAKDIRSSE